MFDGMQALIAVQGLIALMVTSILIAVLKTLSELRKINGRVGRVEEWKENLDAGGKGVVTKDYCSAVHANAMSRIAALEHAVHRRNHDD